MSTSQRDADGSSTDKPPLRPVVRLVVVALAAVTLGYLASLVPTLSRPLRGTPVTVATAILGVVAVVAFALFVAVAARLETVVAGRLAGPGAAVDAAAAALKYLVVFLAFVAIYEPVARAVVPLLADGGTVWVFDLVFTVVALGLLAVVASVVARNLDPLAAVVSQHLRNGDRDGTDPASEEP